MKTTEIVAALKNSDLSQDAIEEIFSIIESQGREIKGFKLPWTPQAIRADLKLASWLKENGDGKTYAEIAKGFGQVYAGVDAETVEQIVVKDQQNTEKYRKFVIDDKGKVHLRVKKAVIPTIKLVKK